MGTIVIKLGSDEPVVSMTSNGKIVWSKGHDIQTANLKLAEEAGRTMSLSIYMIYLIFENETY